MFFKNKAQKSKKKCFYLIPNFLFYGWFFFPPYCVVSPLGQCQRLPTQRSETQVSTSIPHLMSRYQSSRLNGSENKFVSSFDYIRCQIIIVWHLVLFLSFHSFTGSPNGMKSLGRLCELHAWITRKSNPINTMLSCSTERDFFWHSLRCTKLCHRALTLIQSLQCKQITALPGGNIEAVIQFNNRALKRALNLQLLFLYNSIELSKIQKVFCFKKKIKIKIKLAH